MKAVWVIAGKEFRDGLRNRWALAITAVFLVFAVAITYLGASAAGTAGVASLATTIVSLATLAVFLIPLVALLLGYDAVVGEQERGTLLLLLAYPVTRFELLAGKLLGQGALLTLCSAVGFGASGLLVQGLAEGAEGAAVWAAFGRFIVTASLLGMTFLALAYLVSALAGEKARAAGLALVVWFVFVLLYDLALLGTLVVTGGAVPQGLFRGLLLGNPGDVFRLANMAGFEPARAGTDLAGVAGGQEFAPGLLLAVLTAWVAVPFTLAAWRFRRREV